MQFFLQMASKWLPGPKGRIFMGISASLATLATYDKIKKKQEINRCINQVSFISKEPLKVQDYPRKVLVLMADTSYASYTFNSYVKPVFDAAALDYEVITQPDISTSIESMIKSGSNEEEIRNAPPPKPSIWSSFWSNKPPPFDPVARFLALPKYDPSCGLVAVGNGALVDALDGICKGFQNSKGVGQIAPIGLVPGRHMTGWVYAPYRIARWFFERYVAQEVGEAAVAIALGSQTRSFEANDILMGAGGGIVGKGEVDDVDADELFKSTVPVESVREKLQVYIN